MQQGDAGYRPHGLSRKPPHRHGKTAETSFHIRSRDPNKITLLVSPYCNNRQDDDDSFQTGPCPASKLTKPFRTKKKKERCVTHQVGGHRSWPLARCFGAIAVGRPSDIRDELDVLRSLAPPFLEGDAAPSAPLAGVRLPSLVLVPCVMKWAERLSLARGVRATCGGFAAFGTGVGGPCFPFAIGTPTTAAPSVVFASTIDVGCAAAVAAAAVAAAAAAAAELEDGGKPPSVPWWSLPRDDALERVLLPPSAPLAGSPPSPLDDWCLLLLPPRLPSPSLAGEERIAGAASPSRWRCLSRREEDDDVRLSPSPRCLSPSPSREERRRGRTDANAVASAAELRPGLAVSVADRDERVSPGRRRGASAS